MDRVEFASAYPRTLTDEQLHRGPYKEIVREAREWSHAYGEVLHDILSGETPHPEQYGNNYNEWNEETLPLISQLLSTYDDREAQSATQELTFHVMNSAMNALWVPLLYPERQFRSHERIAAINFAQESLALSGLVYYCERERTASKRAGYHYFSDENQGQRSVGEGMVGEFDAAIVLLEQMKRNPDLTVLPAPTQFEDSNNTKNVDFVAIHNDNAIGIQVKSQVQPKDVSRYDTDRVMFIDTRLDLDDVRVLRTKHESSNMQRVTWTGIICAQRVLGIKTKGTKGTPMSTANYYPPQVILQSKMAARELAGGIKPRLPDASKIIGERLMNRLTTVKTVDLTDLPTQVQDTQLIAQIS